MNENGIIEFYHYFFIFLAFLVAILAFGSVTKVWIFKNISVAHQNALLGTFLLGAAGAVVTNYRSLPKLEITRSEHYLFSLNYYDNFYPLNFYSQSPDVYKTCFIETKKLALEKKKQCNKIELLISEQSKALSTRGVGEMYLALNPLAKLYEGLVTFTFAGDPKPIAMSIDGVQLSDEKISLNFIQPSRFQIELKKADVKVAGNTKDFYIKDYSERPPFSYNIIFDKVNKTQIYKGVLYHPSATIKCTLLDNSNNSENNMTNQFSIEYPEKKYVINNPLKMGHCYIPLAVASLVPTF